MNKWVRIALLLAAAVTTSLFLVRAKGGVFADPRTPAWAIRVRLLARPGNWCRGASCEFQLEGDVGASRAASGHADRLEHLCRQRSVLEYQCERVRPSRGSGLGCVLLQGLRCNRERRYRRQPFRSPREGLCLARLQFLALANHSSCDEGFCNPRRRAVPEKPHIEITTRVFAFSP